MSVTDNLIKQAMDLDDYSEAARLSLLQGDDNSAYGFFVLGWIFDEGKIGPSQKQTARRYYECAIAAGSVEANRYLGLLLLESDDYDAAREAFVVGEGRGDNECSDLLSQLDRFESEKLANNAIASGRYEQASKLLQSLAEQDSEYALLTLGFFHQEGRLGRADLHKAKAYYQRAADLGSGDAHYRLGCIALESLDYAAAHAAFMTGADLGDDQCKKVLSERDLFAESELEKAIDSRDFQSAVEHMEKLADLGSASALGEIGWIYHSGQIGTPDLLLAKKYYERAIKAGNTSVSGNMGLLLLEEGEKIQARDAFLRGAEDGQPSCMYQLSRMLRNGDGGTIDVKQADIWLSKAAAQGHLVSQLLKN